MELKPTDKPADYFNFTHPSRWVTPGCFDHRLGKFSTPGVGKRTIGPMPTLGILHVPVAEIRLKDGRDITGERIAEYLANPGEKRSASVHICSDTDSYVLCIPFDSVGWGAGNTKANDAAVQIEMGGMGNEPKAYWESEDAIKKYVQIGQALIKGAQLAYGLDPEVWTKGIPPLKKAVLLFNGAVKEPGWTQHREVPFWNATKNQFDQVGSGGKNQVYGQHADVHENFPWNTFFEVVRQEIERTVLKAKV